MWGSLGWFLQIGVASGPGRESLGLGIPCRMSGSLPTWAWGQARQSMVPMSFTVGSWAVLCQPNLCGGTTPGA